jgi:hypothetical protein
MRKEWAESFPEISIISFQRNFIARLGALDGSVLSIAAEAVLDKA